MNIYAIQIVADFEILAGCRYCIQ